MTARPAAPPTTPPAIVPGGGVLSLLSLLFDTAASELLDGDADSVPCCAGLPTGYAVDTVEGGALLAGVESSGVAESLSSGFSVHCLSCRSQIVDVWPPAKVVTYGFSDRVIVTVW